MARPKNRENTIWGIRQSVKSIFSAGSFSRCEFELPTEVGTQLSMTGLTPAYGNSGEFFYAESDSGFPEGTLEYALSKCPALCNSSDIQIARYALKKRFFVMCGSLDRSVAIVNAVPTMISEGICKIIIAADTPAERDNLFAALSLMKGSLDGVSLSCYRPNEKKSSIKRSNITREVIGSHTRKKLASDCVYEFLASETPEVLIIGRDSFTREGVNLIHSGGESSLCSQISKSAPLLLTSTHTVKGSRSLAECAKVFSPLATVSFVGEVKRLRDAVIYSPSITVKKEKGENVSFPEQLLIK